MPKNKKEEQISWYNKYQNRQQWKLNYQLPLTNLNTCKELTPAKRLTSNYSINFKNCNLDITCFK